MIPRKPRLHITLEPWYVVVEVTVWTHHHDYTDSDHHRATLTAMPLYAPHTDTHHEWKLRLDTTGWLRRPFRYRSHTAEIDADPNKSEYRRGFCWLIGSLRYVATTYTTTRPIIPRPDYPFGGPRG